jgi:uncharacterized protein (DUF1778 family)
MKTDPVAHRKSVISMIVPAEIKAVLQRMAEHHHRSMTSYVEWLILRDAELHDLLSDAQKTRRRPAR